jgi:hypothetical protein
MKTLLLQDRSDREMGHQSFQEASLLSRLAGTQQIHIQRLSPKKKGGFPYIPFRVGYRNGGYSLSNTWLHTTSLAILTSRSRWPFSGLTPGDIPQIHFFSVSLLHSLSLIISLPPSCLPATFPPLMLRPTSRSKASSWFRGLYFHSVIMWPRVVFLAHILIILHISFLPGQASLRSIDRVFSY